MTSFVTSSFPTEKAKTRRYSAEEWEAQKSNVERLYITENRPLKEVLQILEQDFGFTASEKQLKSKLTKWKFDVKNLKAEIVVELARTKAKRALENKKSSFRVNKKPVDDRKIDRYLQRNDISEDQLLSMASPVDAPSPGFSVFTPQSIRSLTPGLDLAGRLSRSSTLGLNFQTLSLLDQESSAQLSLLPTIAEDTIQTKTTVEETPQSSSTSHLQPSVENDVENAEIRYRTPAGGLSIIPGDLLMIHNKMEEIPTYIEWSDEVKSSIEDSVHRSSPYCAWPTPEEEATDQLWMEKRGYGRKEKLKEEWRASTPKPTEIRTTSDYEPPEPVWEDPEPAWKSLPVTHWEALEMASLQTSSGLMERKGVYNLNCIWFCDSCGQDGGMTTIIDHCPGCGHLRCSMCSYEVIETRRAR